MWIEGDPTKGMDHARCDLAVPGLFVEAGGPKVYFITYHQGEHSGMQEGNPLSSSWSRNEMKCWGFTAYIFAQQVRLIRPGISEGNEAIGYETPLRHWLGSNP